MTTSFLTYPFLATGASTSRKMPDRLLDVVNVKDYGALGDGTGALLSSRYASLAAAQVDYPGAESLSDTIDYAAIMAALGWNSIFVQAASKVYSAAVRFTSLTWTGGQATAVTGVPHGLTTGDQIIHWFTSQTDGAEWSNNTGGGIFTVTFSNSTTFTYPITSQPGPAVIPVGCFTPVIASASRTSNVVTVNFSAPHRMVNGITVSMQGFPDGIDSSSHVIAVITTKQLTFSHTGSNGTLSLSPYAWVSMPSTLVVTSWPGIPSFFSAQVYSYYMAQEYPTNYAGNYFAQMNSVPSGTTLTFGGATNPSFFWNSIEAGAIVRLQTPNFGKIYFPPGGYVINKRLDLGHDGVSGIFYGCPGQSIIHGSFPDYLMAEDRIGAGPARWEGLTFVNDDSAGGGLRVVGSNVIVSGCTFKCGNLGITLANQDFRNAVAFDAEITGCIFLPNGSGSVGLADASNNSEVCGNYFKGLATGIRSNNFFHCTDGNLFEDCVIGFDGGTNPFGVQGNSSQGTLRGNAFSNCGASVLCTNNSWHRIEGTSIVGGANSNYGFQGRPGSCFMRGMTATGNFSVAAMQTEPASPPRGARRNLFRSVVAKNTNTGAGVAWQTPTVDGSALLENCNTAKLIIYSGLNGRGVVSAAYNSGTGVVTLTTDSTHLIDNGSRVYVSGVKVSGSTNTSYNGIYTLLSASGSTVTYHVNVAPGSATSGTGSIQNCSVDSCTKPIKSITWDSGTHLITMESLGPHGMINYGAAIYPQAVVGGSYINGFNPGYAPGTVTDSTHFTYAGPSTSPGTVDSASLSTSLPSLTAITPSFFYATDASAGTYVPSIQFDCAESGTKSNISDGQKLGGGTANIGDLVTGGGSQHISVIWTQNGWMRRG